MNSNTVSNIANFDIDVSPEERVAHLTESITELEEKESIEVKIDEIFTRLQEVSNRAKEGDIIMPAKDIKFTENGHLVASGPNLSRDMIITPNAHMLDQMAKALFGQVKYLRRIQEKAPTLIPRHMNDWLKIIQEDTPNKAFLLRCLSTKEDNFFTGRAFLSDSYGIIDNHFIFMTVINAIKEVIEERKAEGKELVIKPITQKLSPGQMQLRFIAPQYESQTELLSRYRNPVTGEPQGKRGLLSGFCIRNSEIGDGAFLFAPRYFCGACNNGLLFIDEAYRRIHHSSKQEPGIVTWSDDTLRAEMEVLKHKLIDLTKTYLSEEFIGKTMGEIEKIGAQVVGSPTYATKNLCKDLGLSDSETEDTLNFLMNQGGAKNAFDIVQAVTFQAHEIKDIRRSFDIEAKVMRKAKNISFYDRNPEEFSAN